MSNRFHLTQRGEPAACSASLRSCPRGGEEAHYSSPQEAQAAYEASMAGNVFQAKFSLKELNALAKEATKPEEFELLLERGSDRTLKNLASNGGTPSSVLESAYARAEKPDTKAALAAHSNFPARALSGEEFARKILDGGWNQALAEDEGVTDEHLQALAQVDAPFSKKLNKQMALTRMLRNGANQLTPAGVAPVAETSFQQMEAAVLSGRYPAERIPTLPQKLVYWNTIDHCKSAKYLDAYAAWAVNAKGGDKHYEVEAIANHVARNEATSPATLQTLAEHGLALEAVYRNEQATPATRELAKASDPEVARYARLEKLGEGTPGGLKSILLVADHTTRPVANRGYSTTSHLLDVKKVKELGLSKEDVYMAMGARNYNGGASYDEESGVFTGSIDSTD